MAVSMETQRLISVSLGKIAQSRGQRGGINLHKNLLVATVLHKARNAYMMESYSYQQNLQRQKLLEQYQLQQQTLQTSVQKIEEASPVGEPNKGETCPSACDSNMEHSAATPTGGEQSRSNVSSESLRVTFSPEPMSVQDSELVVLDKENSPPCVEDRCIIPENVPVSTTKMTSYEGHIAAATQLSQDAQSSHEHILKQQTLTSGSTTCNVLKRRRDNPSASVHDCESPVNKIARIQTDNIVNNYSSDSSNESHPGSQVSHTSDSNQILNLVNIFNSGFSGLCLTSSSEIHGSSYQSSLDISNSQTHVRKIATKAG